MPGPKLSKLEMQIMETLWTCGEASIRDMLVAFPVKKRPGYTTVQNNGFPADGKEGSAPSVRCGAAAATAFSLPVLTERPHPTRLFLKNRGPRQASLLWWKKSRTSLPCPVQSRSENALVDELLAIFGGESRPVVAHLIQAGKLSLDDVDFAEKTLKCLKNKEEA
jgi:BlaI family penicillinase repressor